MPSQRRHELEAKEKRRSRVQPEATTVEITAKNKTNAQTQTHIAGVEKSLFKGQTDKYLLLRV